MKEAIIEANKAFDMGEVPIGAIIVLQEEIVARGHNLKEQIKDATAHAEMVVIKQSIEKLGHWRHLQKATLYVTIEPCPMCAGAIIQSRIRTVVYGAADPKAGAAGSKVDLLKNPALFNHAIEIVSGVMEKECANLMQNFFRKLRHRS